MEARTPIVSRGSRPNPRLRREETELLAAIMFVARRPTDGLLLCGLRSGGRLLATYADRAAAAGVRLEPVRGPGPGVGIRVHAA